MKCFCGWFLGFSVRPFLVEKFRIHGRISEWKVLLYLVVDISRLHEVKCILSECREFGISRLKKTALSTLLISINAGIHISFFKCHFCFQQTRTIAVHGHTLTVWILHYRYSFFFTKYHAIYAFIPRWKSWFFTLIGVWDIDTLSK